MVPNRTTLSCEYVAISGDRVNCTLTTRDIDGAPVAGAAMHDFTVVAAEALLDPTPMWGGPIQFHVEYATCLAGEHNVTVIHHGGDSGHDDANATAVATVVAGQASNFTLACGDGAAEVIAGSEVSCIATTVDACANPSSTPTDEPSAWSAALRGSARHTDGSLDDPTVVPAPELDPAGARYRVTFATGLYWRPGLNASLPGVAGVGVTYANANWTAFCWMKLLIAGRYVEAQAAERSLSERLLARSYVGADTFQ